MPTKYYGTPLCPDCLAADEALRGAGAPTEFINITASTANLKEFLALRDSRAEFAPIKAAGSIGIPCFLREDGSLTFDVAEVAKAGR